jgi:signal transduction histidine kinase
MRQTGHETGFKAIRHGAIALAEAEVAAVSQARTGLKEVELPGMGLLTPSLAGTGVCPAERKRVEAVVETLANLRGNADSLSEVVHDTRNMVTALGLYCDLLEEPGVLTPSFHYYAGELRLVASASRRLVEKLMVLDARQEPVADLSGATGSGAVQSSGARNQTGYAAAARIEATHHWDLLPAQPIDNLAAELLANRNLLAALAGPAIALTVDTEGGALAVQLTGEDLTRILVNLVKNAAEVMPDGGRIQIGLREFHGAGLTAPWLALTVEDSGPGIPHEALEKIFESGYTTHAGGAFKTGGWPASHRGLGLSITHSIIEAAGGQLRATNRKLGGARFEIELPVRLR